MPDYGYMAAYIKAQQKLVIADEKARFEKIISAMYKIIFA